MTIRGLGVAAVFLIGCAAGGVSSQLVVPKASAQPAATLTKWEHHCLSSENSREMTRTANELGEEGWEMTAMTERSTCFKRPKM